MPVTQSHDFFVQWHLTDRCNLKCRHCYHEGASSKEMPFHEVVEVADEVAGMIGEWRELYGIEFSPSVSVTGGEPFLRGDIFRILGALRKRGFDLYVLTNGVLVDRECAGRLAELGVSGVQVSIEGPGEVHENIRGRGSFAPALRGVTNLLGAGLGVTLNGTLSDMNADYFMDVVKLAVALGVRRLGFSRLVPSGRSRAMMDNALPKDRVRELYGEILSVNPRGLDIVTGDPVAAQASAQANGDCGQTALGGCAAGVSGLTLLPDGTVLPCRRLDVPIGNVRADSLREIWAASPVLEALRDRQRYTGRCRGCKRWAVCRGCRAIAYAHSGDFLADDPGCYIEG
jgi:radical SAM protein with 4Fe4S-binding SPASM domain